MIEILLVIGTWLLTVWALTDDEPSKPLKGMSNPILFEEMRDKYFRK